jgi:hypothetical protein
LNAPAAVEILDDELKRAFFLLIETPGIGIAVEGTRLKNIPRVFLRRTGFFLYYRVNTAEDVVEVHALWHSARVGYRGCRLTQVLLTMPTGISRAPAVRRSDIEEHGQRHELDKGSCVPHRTPRRSCSSMS